MVLQEFLTTWVWWGSPLSLMLYWVNQLEWERGRQQDCFARRPLLCGAGAPLPESSAFVTFACQVPAFPCHQAIVDIACWWEARRLHVCDARWNFWFPTHKRCCEFLLPCLSGNCGSGLGCLWEWSPAQPVQISRAQEFP